MPHLNDDELIGLLYAAESDSHVEKCSDCAARLDALRERRAELAGPVPLSAEFLAAQRRAIYARMDHPAPSKLAWAPAMAAACLLAIGVYVYRPVPVAEGVSSLTVIKKAHGVVKRNPGASIVDLGDGVAAIELHSKMNALGEDIVSLITQTLRPTSEQVANFEAFVITGDSANFSVGANLMQL